MNREKPYLNQYYKLFSERLIKKISIENSTETQMQELRELQARAIEESGLDSNELTLI